MTRSIVKRLTKPLDEPEREFQRIRRAAYRLQHNKSLVIAGRNLFDDEASSFKNTRVKPPTPPRTLHEHSHPNSSGFQNPITLPVEQKQRFIDAHDILLIQGTCMFQGLRNKDPLWLEPNLLPRNAYSRGWVEEPYLICDYWEGSHEADECKQTNLAEQVCLFARDIYDDPYLKRFYQNDDTPPWGNIKHKEKGEDGSEWIVRSKSEDEHAKFILEKKSHAKGIGDMLDQHRKELHEQFSQILSTTRIRETPEPEAPRFSITTRLGVSTQDPPFPAPP
ncbi:hypothetical protein Tco_0741639 [Tanacetum coccineum]